MLEEYKEQLKNIFYNKNNLLVLGLVVVFIVLAIYIYREYVVPRMKPSYVSNKEFISKQIQESNILRGKISSQTNIDEFVCDKNNVLILGNDELSIYKMLFACFNDKIKKLYNKVAV